ncbi:transcriptional regulator [Paenibacillus sp. Soil766]|uniref:LysR family transcriptional regulator n=1 Tax=Paenibacillus sp. Soil766 TaxID=1736404 RepID=UPI00070F4C22|nr:LysR family transcriptional regulator [Paenibacillus sp. Soil766]KRE89276.1 transcriptional regulator [Paenibacillus sp. Soil766]
MDLRQLTAFQTILQEGTFSRAAEKLNYAQSTITNQIQRLEKELGLQLFKRGWDAELTNAGRVFATEIDKLIRHWNDVSELAKALQQDEIGSLRVGGIEPTSDYVLPNSLRTFHEHKPRMACQIVMGNTDSLSHSLLQDELDFAICGEPSDPSSFYFEPLYQEKIIFVADRKHPLCERNSIPFREILDFPIMAGGRTCLYYVKLAKQLSRYETVPPLLNTVSRISAIPHFTKQTLSVGVMLDSTPLTSDVTRIHVELDEPFIPIGLLQVRGREYPPASSKNLFMQIVREEIRKIVL